MNKKFNKERKYYIIKSIIFVLLFILLIVLIKINYNDAQRKTALENTIADITTLNSKQTFSIDKIYMYSSANAVNNDTKKSMWNLDIYQYTDIALYISSNSSNDDQNTITEFYIDNIKFESINTGTPNLYYKDMFEFGKFNLINENIITDRLDYQVVDSSLESIQSNTISGNENTANTYPQIYSDCSTPVTLEYVNLIKSNYLVSDISTPLVYDGSLLKKSSIDLSSISCDMSFKLHIKNALGESHVATVKISIPLKDDVAGTSIYDGSLSKEISTITNFTYEK